MEQGDVERRGIGFNTERIKQLEEIDRLLENRDVSRGRLRKLYAALLESEGYEAPSYKRTTVDMLNAEQISRDSQRFFAAAMLRLLAMEPETIYDDPDVKREAARLFDTMPDIAKQLHIPEDAQTFEKLKTLQSAFPRARDDLKRAFKSCDTLDAFGAVRQDIMRRLNQSLVANLIRPFLPAEIIERQIPDTLRAINSYLEAGPRKQYKAYKDAMRESGRLERSVTEINIGFLRSVLHPFATSLKDALEEHHSASPYSKPGSVEVTSVPRKYPLGALNLEPRFEFRVTNQGPGYAMAVELHLDADETRVKLKDQERFLGTLPPGTSLGKVQFEGEVCEADSSPVLVHGKVMWRNPDHSEESDEFLFELESQREDIPWKQLEWEDPYSLEPVESMEELVGRRDLTGRLLARLRAKRIGSFWIFGQKRVGKTSLVRAVQSELRDSSNIACVYLEAGDYIDPDPEQTVAGMGSKICQKLKASDQRLEEIPIPEFERALAPLSQFLDSARQSCPNLKFVIILDEFDDLPSAVYRRGELGNAVFLSIRSVSAKADCGFILVGGEKMQLVLSAQGQALNKFKTLRVDYLDASNHWSDFEDLVRKPVENWATFTDSAINGLYHASAGNPFFAKYLCGVLFRSMVERRDAFVDEGEVSEGIEAAVWQAGSNQFQHFWDDGIFEQTGDRVEEVSMRRRRVLLGLSECLRQGHDTSIEEIATKCEKYGVSENSIRKELENFEGREILKRLSDGNYKAKVGLFGRWLKERGVNEIITTFTQLDAILERKKQEEQDRVTPEELSELVSTWGLYRGERVGEERVRAWLSQFADVREQRRMFELLQGLYFYSKKKIRELIRVGHDGVVRHLAQKGVVRKVPEGGRKTTDNVLISYLGPVGKRGPYYSKIYVDENQIYYERVAEPKQVSRAARELPDVEGVVFIEDFVGTGGTIRSAVLDMREDLAHLSERGVELFLVIISGFGTVVDEIEEEMIEQGVTINCHIIDPLGPENRCFHSESQIFPDELKRTEAKDIAYRYGMEIDSKQPLGYGDTEAVVVFESMCPNNSLPILWGKTREWEPLFPRR